nr:PHB depolymerase family esterase [Candidatus Sigynarchaeota archaeon]
MRHTMVSLERKHGNRLDACIQLHAVPSSLDGKNLHYNLFLPTTLTSIDKRMPLLVILHGTNPRTKIFLSRTKAIHPAEEYGFAVVSPIARRYQFYTHESEQDMLDIIDSVVAAHPIDEKRVFLVGNSVGGWGAYYLGLKQAGKFAGIGAFTAPVDLPMLYQQLMEHEPGHYGPGNEGLKHVFKETFGATPDEQPSLFTPFTLKGLLEFATATSPRVFIGHGRKDKTVPVEWVQRMLSGLEAKGVPAKLALTWDGHGMVVFHKKCFEMLEYFGLAF